MATLALVALSTAKPIPVSSVRLIGICLVIEKQILIVWTGEQRYCSSRYACFPD
jgi:hypothetical protein